MKNFTSILLVLICMLAFTTTKAQQNPENIPFERYSGNQRVITVTIEGISAHFLFDTGAGSTIISPALAQKLNMKPNGVFTTYNRDGKRIDQKRGNPLYISVGTSSLFQKQILIAETNFPATIGHPLIDGILSLKSFEDKIITVDFSKNLLILENNESFQTRKTAMIQLESLFANGINGQELNVFVGVEVKKKKLWMKFDSGNGDRVILSKNAASLTGLFTDSVLNSKEYIQAGEVPYVIQAAIAENLNTVVKDIIYDGIFNYSYISGNSYTLDLKQKIIYIEPL